MSKEEELYSTIDYQFHGDYDNVIWFEEICNSLNLEVEKYWMRELDDINLLTGDNIIVVRDKPEISELYQLTYSLLIANYNTNNVAKFAEFLIDSMLETCGYLEACLKQEISKNKEEK